MATKMGKTTYVTGLECIQCGAKFPEGPMLNGCPACRRPGWASNVTVTYDLEAARRDTGLGFLEDLRATVWKAAPLLPVGNPDHRLSLGEGGTPLIPFRHGQELFGLPTMYLKDESRNATWSHKDRMCAVAVSKGLEFGAKVIAVSSTGNHGASAAAYSALAGLPCVVFTVAYTASTMMTFMQAYGAKVVALQSSADRMKLLARCVEEWGWYPTASYSDPPLGNNPFGTDGYKTIAYEVWTQLGRRAPDVIIAPVSYASTLFGVFKGFAELRSLGLIPKIPRHIAVERFGHLEKAEVEGLDHLEPVRVQPTVAVSIAGTTSSMYGLKAIRGSHGTALAVEEAPIIEMQQTLAHRGYFYEASSVAGFVGVREAATRGLIHPVESVVLIVTSSGLKDPSVIQRNLPVVPTVQPDLDSLARVLADVYRCDVRTMAGA